LPVEFVAGDTLFLRIINQAVMRQSALCLSRSLFPILTALALAGCSGPEAQAPSKPAPAAAASKAPSERTALDDYVAKPDPNYGFHLVKSVPGEGLTTYVLEMTSQAWLTTNEVDRPLWKHWLIIAKPDNVVGSKGFLFISGGGNGGTPPSSGDENMPRSRS
jgi:PhoPQ-activated pathogenicity-related protein